MGCGADAEPVDYVRKNIKFGLDYEYSMYEEKTKEWGVLFIDDAVILCK